METHYICTGGCGGKVTEEEYMKGANVCQADGCPHKGQPLERRVWCAECQAHFREEENHKHG